MLEYRSGRIAAAVNPLRASLDSPDLFCKATGLLFRAMCAHRLGQKGDADKLWEDRGEKDELYGEAVRQVMVSGQASASHLQRRLKLGYARAARIIDQMEQEGLIGESEGSKPRAILVDPRAYLKELEKGKAQKKEI
jgi:DNA segregation ATPase FtsK/SpoIIIE-like protein